MNQFFLNKTELIRKSIPYEDGRLIYKTFSGERLIRFRMVNSDDVTDIIKQYGIKTSADDPLPAKILSSVIDSLLPLFVKLINKSFTTCSLDGVK